MSGDYYCPLKRNPEDGGNVPCFLDDCAWYDREVGVCAVLAIGRALRRLS